MTPEPTEIPTRDGSIRLGQFLKLANVVGSGADAKFVLAEGEIRVNGEPESRRGRQLRRGDLVQVGEVVLRVG